MTLFVLMVPAGMPELSRRSDVAFIEQMLALEKTDEEAAGHYGREIDKALAAVSRRLDNLAHTMKHS
jgi:phosphatidylinositol-4,5-bisphosphate 3-kinase